VRGARAAERGAQVVGGRCWEGGGAPPYWPWVQALRSCAGEPLPAGPGTSEVGDLVLRLVRQASDAPVVTSRLSAEYARFQLFDATALVLKNLSRSRPLVLVLDDLHWADGVSLKLLEFVGRELGDAAILVLGTYRG